MNRRTVLGSALIGAAASAAGVASAKPAAQSAARASGRTGPLNLITDVEGLKVGQAHDAGVRTVTDRLLVMQAGKIVEQGDTAAVFAAPSHPYTCLLYTSPSPRD